MDPLNQVVVHSYHTRVCAQMQDYEDSVREQLARYKQLHLEKLDKFFAEADVKKPKAARSSKQLLNQRQIMQTLAKQVRPRSAASSDANAWSKARTVERLFTCPSVTTSQAEETRRHLYIMALVGNTDAHTYATHTQGKYEEAEAVKKLADKMEKAEMDATQGTYEAEVALKEQQLRSKQQQETEGLLHRAGRGRDELRLTRQLDLERRQQRFKNVTAELHNLQVPSNRLRGSSAVSAVEWLDVSVWRPLSLSLACCVALRRRPALQSLQLASYSG